MEEEQEREQKLECNKVLLFDISTEILQGINTFF